MGRKKQKKVLDVYYSDVIIGSLTKATDGQISFKYSETWIDVGFGISLSLPLREQEYTGEIVSRYFDNLLPDNDKLLKNIALKYGAESTRSFDLLSVIGRDCVGALTFLPEGFEPTSAYELNLKPLTENEIAEKLKNLSKTSPLGMNSESDFRLSIAGAQEKTALTLHKNKWYEPKGLTPTTHIIKSKMGALSQQVDFFDSVDNEWSSLYLMRKLGFETCKAEIHTFEDQRVLVVERFDRKHKKIDGKQAILRLSQEDMCQALGISPTQKYEKSGGPGIQKIADILRASLNQEDRLKFFKSIMAFDLLYAIDGHGKNFSLFLSKQGHQLTPFYDVMGAYFLEKREGRHPKNIRFAMKVGNTGKDRISTIFERHYKETAKLCGINEKKYEEIRAELKDAYNNMTVTTDELDPNLNKETLEIILEGMEKRADVIF